MNTINISKKKLNSLESIEFSRNVFHTEGAIYNFDYRGKNKILKILYNSNGVLFANKLYTVEMLDYYKESLPESFLCPDNLVSISGEVSGFTIPKFDGVNLADLLHFKEIENKEKIYYLIKIGEILNQLKSIREYGNLKQIFINDLQEANIMVNPKNKELKIIDLDSCKILNNDFFPARYLGANHFVNDKKHKYIHNSDDDVIANENSDLLCYNIIILNYLYGSSITRISIDEYYEYLNYLDKLKFNKYLLDCFNKLTLCCDNKNPVGFLDTITNEQAIRAKKLVFEYNKR